MKGASSTAALATTAMLKAPGTDALSFQSNSTSCCSHLIAAGLGERVFFPNQTVYEDRIDSYWSVSAQLRPNCVIQPQSAEEVSLTVTTLVGDSGCQFAVRSGGHTTWAGANNIENGVTIDLGDMNTTTFHPENSTVTILPGSRWLQVYQTLDAIGMTVPGGRAGTVGVAGLVTGGGNSFYSAQTGMVCDAVVNYEVVLASGEIIYANNDANPDLFRALKGGSGNFGIVTRFDMEAFEASKLWGGATMYNKTYSDQLLDAMVDFTDHVVDDQLSSSIIFWTYQPALLDTVVLAAYENTAGEVAPPAFDKYMAIPANISSTMRITNISDITHELEQPTGYRDMWFTLSFKNDERVLSKAVELHNQLVEEMKIESSDGDFITQCMFQPMPSLYAKQSVEKGGNMLGLDKVKENAILWLATLAVKGADQELIGRQKMITWVNAVEEYATSIDAHNDWIYLNYADSTQKPLESYGAENVEKIRAAAAKYDPTGVFQTRVPGGFKISHVTAV
ncbi:uncharacterized protein BCR38DRAFT_424491 [Pseudomassariella vexata]|uniref:FAD-binding PCMH-type domain-containing protein n=1 Tax=Pseudomassariella vexata TaxID=1141098 RepID=A0A1Y2EC56_9PEZI|nr:uncharacterized protein BCR38DRAFT_424491 [Pseudomassariella vexata]ORY68846.1 hypothetical protein BCR38DRAFT_424491 [Pseudomassariella vexata]